MLPFIKQGIAAVLSLWQSGGYVAFLQYRLFFRLVADFNAANLAADGFWQFVDKFHHARILVGGGGALHVVLDVFYQRLVCPVFVVFRQHDGGFDNLPADFVWYAGDGAFNHGGMGHQRTLYLKRADAVARRLDDIVLAADKPVIAVLVAPCHVAGVVDAVVPCLVCQFGVAVVLLEQSELKKVLWFAMFCAVSV